MGGRSPGRQVFLDTDIGTDVDDALALAMLLGSPEVHLVGITTVYGDTLLRARIASRLARLAGHDGLVIVPGAARTLAGDDAFMAGIEGGLYVGLEGEPVPSEPGADRALIQASRKHAGELEVVAIGPLTNVASALTADPGFCDRIRRLYVMGGRFDGDGPEHNLASDPEAAAVVFGSEIPVTVVGWEITTQIRLGVGALAGLMAGGRLGAQLAAETVQWWDYLRHRWNHPHDMVAALALLCPQLLGTRPVEIRVDGSGDRPGHSVALDRPGSSTLLVDSIDQRPAVSEMLSRITRAGRGAGDAGGQL